MKIKQHLMCVVMAAIILLLITGCAVFPGNKLPTVEKFQPFPEATKKLTVTYSFSSGVDFFDKLEHEENVRTMLEKEFTDTLTESGYFASVSQGNQEDLKMQVRLVDSGSPAGMGPAIITGLSLYTIPSWATENYNVTAKVTAPGGIEHTYQLTDSVTLVQWLPMIVVFPFKNLFNVPPEVRKNIWKNLIIKMQKDGLLSQKEKIGPVSKTYIKLEWSYTA